ncbi:nucleotide-diphospho-sugar transferase [Leucosporidium creatinivorum]|uniref:Nucleotide-diphospho-sugar transferase n=1 Tax=Leucosporidium creatinivorum TaxID=106004 RepID=A0A1Y2E8U6_9BASI|nr:nucleotide-diphospho-sugar transferase [Leucosporidium creatinivorum]
MAYNSRSLSPKRGSTRHLDRPPFPSPSVVLLTYLNPSPWLSNHPAIFLRPPPPIPSLSTSITPPVKGCQNVELTRLESREKAAIVLLLREKDLDDLLPTLKNFEKRFNAAFRYPYVFISSPDEGPFSPSFRSSVLATLPPNAAVEWSVVKKEHWRIPEWMDEEVVRRGFKDQEEMGVQYAGREGYHHMIRWYSGLWAREEVLQKYDWYWRLEPGVRFYCTITYDPFRFMALHNKVYGFVIAIVENMNTIPTLFSTIKKYAQRKGIKTEGKALWEEFLIKKQGGSKEEEYTGCHQWTNFEIGDLRFFRSAPYQELFNELVAAGGFYTERWGDAPIRSLALGLLTDVDQVHYFEDFAYQHDWFMHCPTKKTGLGCDCQCPAYSKDPLPKNELTDVDNDWRFSCLPRWRRATERVW